MQLTIPQRTRAQLEFNTSLGGLLQPETRRALDRAFSHAAAAFTAEHGRAPETLDDIEAVVSPLAEYQAYRAWSALVSERMWRELSTLLSLNEETIDRELRSVPDTGLGELRLNSALELPDYYRQAEFHLAPGNYQGSHMYALHTESQLTSVVSKKTWPSVKQIFDRSIPKRAYRRIVDLGAGLGRGTVALKELFPDAEVIGVDLAEPELLYAHWESERRGLAITYVQADATDTGLAGASTDLVVAYILHHELPPEAMRALIREAHRLLRPGGLFMNGDVTPYRHMLPLTRYLLDRQVETGAEPFWRVAGEMDLPADHAAVGFDHIREEPPPGHPHGLHFPWWTIGQKASREE